MNFNQPNSIRCHGSLVKRISYFCWSLFSSCHMGSSFKYQLHNGPTHLVTLTIKNMAEPSIQEANNDFEPYHQIISNPQMSADWQSKQPAAGLRSPRTFFSSTSAITWRSCAEMVVLDLRLMIVNCFYGTSKIGQLRTLMFNQTMRTT